MSVNYDVIKDRLFKRISRTGEEIKNDFPNVLRDAIKHKIWQHYTKADGTKFNNLGEWLTYSFPNGCSMGGQSYFISYEDALQLTSGYRELHGLLVKHRPSTSGKQGGRPKKETVDNINGFPKRATGTSRAYIEQRLQQDHPKIWKEYRDGKIKSARQAGIQAGFIKDSHDPLKRLKSNWNKATKRQRDEFIEFLVGEGWIID